MTETNGIVSIPSRYSVDETVSRLEKTLAEKGIKLFALIDHSGEAEKADLKMPPTKVAIFGSPKAGTPLMLASPSIAIDLPLKLLIYECENGEHKDGEDTNGSVFVSWNAPAYLATRHALPPELLANIAVIEKLAAAIAG